MCLSKLFSRLTQKIFLFFVSIVYNDEYSARLSVSSILRLRSAAITALSDDSSADSAMIRKLARRILHVNKYHENGDSNCISLPASITSNLVGDQSNHIHNRRQFEHTITGRGFYIYIAMKGISHTYVCC